MNLKTLLTVTLLSCGSLLVTACAHQGHERGVTTLVDDSAITAKVKSALLREKDVNSFEIKVETFNGTVQLSGFVDSQWQIDKAAAIAANVGGVQNVKNDLIHKTQ